MANRPAQFELLRHGSRRVQLILRCLCLYAVLFAQLAPVQAQTTQEDEVRTWLEDAAHQIAGGEYSKALETLQRVEKSEPDNPWLWFFRGTAQYQLNEPYRAMDA